MPISFLCTNGPCKCRQPRVIEWVCHGLLDPIRTHMNPIPDVWMFSGSHMSIQAAIPEVWLPILLLTVANHTGPSLVEAALVGLLLFWIRNLQGTASKLYSREGVHADKRSTRLQKLVLVLILLREPTGIWKLPPMLLPHMFRRNLSCVPSGLREPLSKPCLPEIHSLRCVIHFQIKYPLTINWYSSFRIAFRGVPLDPCFAVNLRIYFLQTRFQKQLCILMSHGLLEYTMMNHVRQGYRWNLWRWLWRMITWAVDLGCFSQGRKCGHGQEEWTDTQYTHIHAFSYGYDGLKWHL